MFTKKKLGIPVATIAALIAIVTGLFTIDSRYANAEITEERMEQLLEKTNTAILDSKQDTINILLDYRIEYYSDQIDLMLIRGGERELSPIEQRRLEQTTKSLERLLEEKDRRLLGNED